MSSAPSGSKGERRAADGPRRHAAAATGAIAGAAFVLGRRAIIDPWTASIAVGTFVLLTRAKRVPEPLVIIAAGAVGLALATFGAH